MTSTKPVARKRLLDAGMQLLRERGYDATRVEDLCIAAGVTKGAFFHHFASKADYGVAAAQHWTAMTAPMFAAADYHAAPTPLARILAYLDLRRAMIAGTAAQFSCVAGMMAQEVFETQPAIRAACGASIAGHAATLENDFAAAIAAHAPAATLDARGLALHSQTVLQGAYVMAKALDDPAVAIASIDHLQRYIMILFGKEKTMTTKVQGNPVWYELMTSDPAGATAFYGAVLGWTARDSGQPGMGYQLLASAHGDVAGLMALPGGAPMPPGWFGYVGVDDLEASLAALTTAGGALHMPPTEVPGAGRFAMVADPAGVIFYLMQPAGSEPSRSFSTDLVGHCSWNELATTDQAAALGFYGNVFGWRAGDAMDMGPMGKYQFISHGDAGLGAMMTAPPGTTPGWTYYFRVADIDAAVAAVTLSGGQIEHGPSEVPGNDHIIQGRDPQGAAFALVGKRRSA